MSVFPTKHYRGFLIPDGVFQSEQGLLVKYGISQANFHLPRYFRWKGSNQEDLRIYIDGLVDRRQLVTQQYEDADLAVDLHYEDPPPCKTIVVSPQLLMSVLRGEFLLEIPAGTTVRCRDPEELGRFVVTKFDAAAVDKQVLPMYFDAIREAAHEGKALWLEDRITALEKSRRSFDAPGDSTLRAALEHGVQAQTVNPAPLPPPAEETLSTRQIGSVTEVISVVVTEPPYFVRRLFDSGGNLQQAYSAWSAKGPWEAS